MTVGSLPKVAVAGVGYWGRNLARNFAELGSLAGVIDNFPATANEVAAANGTVVLTLDEALADPSVDGIAIATTAVTHFEVARAALNAGKHVFVEKPLVLDETDADELIALAGDRGRLLMVGHLLRYHPVFRRMLELVRSGEFGPVRYIHSDRLSLGKVRTEEDVLWSFAPHDISMVLALAGEEPDTVTAQGAAVLNPAIADVATAQLGFPSGVKASIKASWLHYRKVQQIVAVCDKATIVFEDSEADWNRKLAIHEHGFEMQQGAPVLSRGDHRYVEVPTDEPLKCECRHFLERMADGETPLTDGREGRAVLRVLRRATADMAAAKSAGARA